MYTDVKIKTLMSIYRISNITLARGVGADPSLVSRWRSGEREPSADMLRDMAGFLSSLHMLPHDRAALAQTVGAPCQERPDTARAILLWLQSDSTASLPESMTTPEKEPEIPETQPSSPEMTVSEQPGPTEDPVQSTEPAPPQAPQSSPAETTLSFHSGGATVSAPERRWQGWIPMAFATPAIPRTPQEALDVKMKILAKPGLCMLHKTSLSGFFLPTELVRAQFPLTAALQTEMLADERRFFERHASADGWVEFLPTALYDAVSINGSCAVHAFELFGQKGLTLSGDALRATLQVILACLQRYPGFRLVWLEEPPQRRVILREEQEALYMQDQPFSAVYLDGTASRLEAMPPPAPAGPGDRGEEMLTDMIDSLI